MIAPYFDTAVVEHVRLGRMGTILGGRFALADRVQRIRAAERRLATRIDDGGYDAVLAHPCWLTQTRRYSATCEPPLSTTCTRFAGRA